MGSLVLPRLGAHLGSGFLFPLQWICFSWPFAGLTGSLLPNIPAQWPFLTSPGTQHPGCPLHPPHPLHPLYCFHGPEHLTAFCIHLCLCLWSIPLRLRGQRPCRYAQLLGPQHKEQESTFPVAERINKHCPAGWGEVDFQLLQSDPRACPHKPGVRSKILIANPPGRNDEQHLTDEDHGIPG